MNTRAASPSCRSTSPTRAP
uniref:Uncharacterized protein n=1 Tax=Arundo donax TaxID=35708 RepID=A0A0A9EH05_ARUDO